MIIFSIAFVIGAAFVAGGLGAIGSGLKAVADALRPAPGAVEPPRPSVFGRRGRGGEH